MVVAVASTIARSVNRGTSKPLNWCRKWQLQTFRSLILETVSQSVKLRRLSDLDSGIVELTLDRPETKNAIGNDMLAGLQHSLETIKRDLSSRVMMICSAVPKTFCAGADLKNMLLSVASISEGRKYISLELQFLSSSQERRTKSPAEVQSFVNNLRSTFSVLEGLDIPTIAVIEGVALGGGLEMALSCDLRVCGEDALMGLPETGLAIIPGAGGTQRLSRLAGKSIAKELIFTGRKVRGTEALSLGIVNYCVPSGSAYSKALEIAREIIQKGPIAVRMAKRAIDEGLDMDMASALRLEEECYQQVLKTKDRLEGLAAFAEKRKPRYTGE